MFDDPEFGSPSFVDVWTLPPPTRADVAYMREALGGSLYWRGGSYGFYTKYPNEDTGEPARFQISVMRVTPRFYGFSLAAPITVLFGTVIEHQFLHPVALFLYLHPQVRRLEGFTADIDILKRLTAWAAAPVD